ncbi:hypothetical protein [Glaciecola petra]|uniref:Uncharacterized protein n=1 Tax=Glaciecola petra TaxID=3075602 RepID=A0ABU2ZTI1_9ALTE|nr:hypothetical protein [Aestuariibacter sp. P117]MDT0594874.1 hypothetical protein [Aestuariibacter sp. P117]
MNNKPTIRRLAISKLWNQDLLLNDNMPFTKKIGLKVMMQPSVNIPKPKRINNIQIFRGV